MEYRIKLEHKGETIEVKPVHNPKKLVEDTMELFIGGNRIDLHHAGHEFLSNKHLVCRIYAALLAEVKATPKTYFKSLTFAKLVPAVRSIVSVDQFLRDIRRMNQSVSNRLDDKISEEISAAVRGAINWGYDKSVKFSDCENWVLSVVSSYETLARGDYKHSYIGGETDSSDLENLYYPLKDDDSKFKAKLKEFKAYPFAKIIGAHAAKEILDKLTESYESVDAAIAEFRTMRDIAGKDVVNWGPHKYAAQLKKQNLKATGWQAQRWLWDLKESLIKKGVKPAELKVSSVTRLKAKPANTLTQDDLVKLFKTGTEGQASGYISQMTPETAVSLLGMDTKNVTEKLYTDGYEKNTFRPTSGLFAIGRLVTPKWVDSDTFKAFMKFVRAKGLYQACTYELFLNHVGEYKLSDFVRFVTGERHAVLPEGVKHLDREFFDNVASHLPKPYAIDRYITDAFLRYQATDADKSKLLAELAKGPDGAGILIDFKLSGVHFKNLPYATIHDFLSEGYSDGDHIPDEIEAFGDLIIQNKDTEIARDTLISNKGYVFDKLAYDLFKLFDFNQRVEILDTNESKEFDLKKVFNAAELKDFGRVALTKPNLCSYIEQLPVKYLNENVQLADVTARVLDSNLHIPLTDKTVRALNKESAKRVLARAQLVGSESKAENVGLKEKLYSKLNRAEVLELLQQPLYESPDYMALSKHMNESELVEAARRSETFVRTHLDKLPDSYVAIYKDKTRFKGLVGDRRDRRNDKFGAELEARLATLN